MDVLGRGVEPVYRDVDGHLARMHKSCAKLYDAGKPYPAAPPGPEAVLGLDPRGAPPPLCGSGRRG